MLMSWEVRDIGVAMAREIKCDRWEKGDVLQA